MFLRVSVYPRRCDIQSKWEKREAEEGSLSYCSEWTGIEIDTGRIYQAKLAEQVADLRCEKIVGTGKMARGDGEKRKEL